MYAEIPFKFKDLAILKKFCKCGGRVECSLGFFFICITISIVLQATDIKVAHLNSCLNLSTTPLGVHCLVLSPFLNFFIGTGTFLN